MDGQRSLVSRLAGAVILLDALLARLALAADDSRVYVLGHPIPWECSLRRIGLPCPTCGLTRSMVMALHGELGRAWHMAPGGPVLLGGALLLAAALLLGSVRPAPAPRWMRAAGFAYASMAAIVWLGGWAAQFAAAWHAR